MKLEIGSGPHPRTGYKHLDIDPKAKDLDYVAPAWKIPERDSVFTEIYARHFLEHLSPDKADETLIEWRRVLRAGGMVHIIVPDLEYHARQILDPDKKAEFVNGTNFRHAMAAFFGWQGRGDNYFHYWGYTHRSIEELFVSHKYRVEHIKCRACDIEIKAYKE